MIKESYSFKKSVLGAHSILASQVQMCPRGAHRQVCSAVDKVYVPIAENMVLWKGHSKLTFQFRTGITRKSCEKRIIRRAIYCMLPQLTQL